MRFYRAEYEAMYAFIKNNIQLQSVLNATKEYQQKAKVNTPTTYHGVR